jgi:antitoxin component YwqK of YwqJK toxin-antitoxin module
VEGNLKGGELDGLITYWDEDGNVTKIEIYKDGKKVQ